jgi:hypothetical protein
MADFKFMTTTEHLRRLLLNREIDAIVTTDSQGQSVVFDTGSNVRLDWVLRLARTTLTLHRLRNPHASVLEARGSPLQPALCTVGTRPR